MNPDLEKLLALQVKDEALRVLDERLAEVIEERTALDAAIVQARATLEAADKALQEGQRRQGDLEIKVDSLRTIQERRRQRMEQVRTAREAQALTIELDAARGIIIKEENEWVRVAEGVRGLEAARTEAQATLDALESGQTEARASLTEREAELRAEREASEAIRVSAAKGVNRPLLLRYDRLRTARSAEVIVAMHGAACGACYTAIPMNLRSQIRSGALIEGCEACGVLLYAAETSA